MVYSKTSIFSLITSSLFVQEEQFLIKKCLNIPLVLFTLWQDKVPAIFLGKDNNCFNKAFR